MFDVAKLYSYDATYCRNSKKVSIFVMKTSYLIDYACK
jgi:hypothetical protein